jgi:hypothetical protein
MSPFDSPLQNWLMSNVSCSLLEVLNQNLKLKFSSNGFWFELLNIHINEKTITCHDFHGFKWQNINIYQILIVFLCGLMPFLACWIVIAPSNKFFLVWLFDFYSQHTIAFGWVLGMCEYIKGCNLVVWLSVVKVTHRLYMSVGTRYMGGYPPQPQLHTWAL